MRDKFGRFIKGIQPWNTGKKMDKTKMNLSGLSLGCKKGHKKWGGAVFEKGHPDFVPQESRGHSEETKKKMSLSGRGEHNGDKAWNWKGGVSRAYKTGYYSVEYKKWRLAVFERDKYKCQGCEQVGGYLTAHHIKSFAQYPELRFELDNGITLCDECHKLTDNYGGKSKKRRLS